MLTKVGTWIGYVTKFVGLSSFVKEIGSCYYACMEINFRVLPVTQTFCVYKRQFSFVFTKFWQRVLNYTVSIKKRPTYGLL